MSGFLAHHKELLIGLAVLLALLVLAAVCYVIVKRRREEPEVSEEPAMRKSSEAFKAAAVALKALLAANKSRYSVPWLLVAGDDRSGKSAMLSALRQTLRLDGGTGEAGSGGPCDWWFFERGVALDLRIGEADDSGWNGIMRLLQRYRPRLPADALLLTIPATDLLVEGEEWYGALAEKAALWKRRLWQAQKRLGLKLPIYVLVTKCDRIDGFRGFWRHLPESRQGEMFGWSSPYALDAAYSGRWTGEAFDTLSQSLDRLQFELAADPACKGDCDALVGFPAHFAAIEEPLRVYLDEVFETSAFYDQMPLRGIWFTGRLSDEGDRTPVLLRDLFERKIFAERGLVKPLPRQLISSNRLVFSLQMALAAVILFSLGAVAALVRLDREVDDLQPTLESVAASIDTVDSKKSEVSHMGNGVEDGADLKFFQQNDAVKLLELMAKIRSHDLESYFVPLSLASGANDDFRTFLAHGFDNVILEAMNGQLELRTRKAITSADKALAAEDDDANSVSFEEIGDFKAVDTYFASLQSTAKLAGRYVQLDKTQNVDEVRALVAELFSGTLPADFNLHDALFRKVLEDVKKQQFSFDDFRAPATARARDLVWRLYNHLFETGAIPSQLLSATKLVTALNVPAASLDDEAEQMKQTLAALDRLGELLAKPEAAWIEYEKFDRGAIFDKYFADMQDGQSFLDPALKDEFHTLGQKEFDIFQNRIGAYSAPLIGPLLKRDENGHVRRELSQGAQDLADLLRGLFSQDFMKVPPPAEAVHHFDNRRRLVWNADKLSEAVAFQDHYQQFFETHKASRPETASLLGRAQRLAKSRLQANMTASLVQAQSYQDVEPSQSMANEEVLDGDMRNFRAAEPLLDHLRSLFHQMDMYEPGAILRDVANDQAYFLLVRIDLLLQTDELYQPPAPLARWDGTTGAGLYAYGVADSAEMQHYLDTERDRIEHLHHDYGAPLVAFLAGQPVSRMPIERAVYTRWQSIAEDIGRYEAHRPDNALSALENFIRGDLSSMTLAKCGGLPVVSRGASDYFEQRRLFVITQFRERCADLGGHTLSERYRSLALRFNDTLAGHYPFGGTAGDDEADEATVRAFFSDYGGDIQSLADQIAGFGTDGDAGRMAAFLRDLAQVAQFIKGLDDGDGRGGLAAKLGVEFRVNRDHERGANQVIEWSMQSGDGKVTDADKGPSLLWRPGDPVRVSFRWAQDAPVRPRRSPDQEKSDDLTASYVFGGRWGLIRLTDTYADWAQMAAARALPPRAILLGFAVPVEPGKDPAQLYVRLSVGSVDPAKGGKGAPLTIPPFPAAAPEPVSISAGGSP